MVLKSLWESEEWFLLSSSAWALFPIKCCFPAPGCEWGPSQSSCDSYSEEFDLLLLSPHKASAVNNRRGCYWLRECVLYFTELTGGKPRRKKDLLAGILRLEAYLLPVKPVNG